MKPEYIIEASALGLFMVSAAFVTTIVEHPGSQLHSLVTAPLARQALIGIGMGLTLIALVYSRAGQRSGAHMNPAVTLTFWRLGKIQGRDAFAYAASQFVGAVIGLGAAAIVAGSWLRDPAVAYVATRPGPSGVLVAFAAEAVISFGVMLLVLTASNTPRLMRYTGLFVGMLVACYITFEAPLSGMSMNPARTLAPVLVGGIATPLWVYFTAPPLGMIAASELFVYLRGTHGVMCAKFHHPPSGECIFKCEWRPYQPAKTAPADRQDPARRADRIAAG